MLSKTYCTEIIIIKSLFIKSTKQCGLLAIFSCMKLSLSSMHNKGFFRIFIDVEKRSDSWRLILIDGVTPSQVQIRYSGTLSWNYFCRSIKKQLSMQSWRLMLPNWKVVGSIYLWQKAVQISRYFESTNIYWNADQSSRLFVSTQFHKQNRG